MSSGKEIKYDVHVRDGDRWTIFTDSATKAGAVAEARALLSSRKFDGAKVTEERGQVREIVVFEESIERHAEPVITAVPIETAPVCRTVEEFCEFRSRRALGRLLRRYLDHHDMTPSELMFDDARIREFELDETLYFQALQLVAGVQSRRSGERPDERIDFIERAVSQIVDRCRAYRDLEIAARDPARNGLSRCVKQLAKETDDEDAGIYRQILFAKLLSAARDWESKLVLLLDQVGPRAIPEVVELVDEGIAEIFDSAEAVRELLGYQRNTASGLRALMQLGSGTYEVSEGSESPLERLSVLIAGRDMPRTRSIMIDQVARTIGGIQPLTKGNRAEERDAFNELLHDFAGGRAFENAELGEAMTTRACLVYGDGFTDLAPANAVDQVLGLLENDAVRFSYLLDLCGTDFGIAHQGHVVAMMAQIVNGLTTIATLVGPNVSHDDVIRAAAHIRDRLLSTRLPDRWRLRFAKVIYELLLDYDSRAGGGRKVAIARLAADAEAPAARKAPKAASTAAAPTPKEFAKPDKAAGLDQKIFAPGKYIFREGDAGEEAYLIHRGRVAIIRDAGEAQVVIAHAGPGSIIGEMALIDRAPRMASAKAEEETEVTVIPLADMQKRLERLAKADPVMRHLVGMFVQRMRDYQVISVES